MAFLAQNILYLIILLVLLLVSGAFSGSETVLFSLSRHERLRMRKSPNRLEAIAASLLENPRSLITTLMIGNLGCNTLVFVVSSVLLARLQAHLQQRLHGAWAAAIVGLLLFLPPLAVTYLADVLPKVLGRLFNRRLAPLLAVPVPVLVRALWPVTAAIDVAIIRPVHRLIGIRHRPYDFSTEEMRELLEMSQEQGVIDVSENELLQEVVRIGDLHVRDVMTPRVDMLAHNVKDPPDQLVELFRRSHLAKLPVFDGPIDNIIGLVYARDLFLAPRDPRPDLRKLLRPVQFVPEFLTLDRLIARFRATGTQLAIVVDEFGGVIGIATLEDVVEQMVGDIYEPHDHPVLATERLGPDEYRVAGGLSVVDWMEAFGTPQTRIETTRTSTVAGLLADRLKRIPKVGDHVRIGHLLLTVESMKGRRVDRVRLKLLDESTAHADEPAVRAAALFPLLPLALLLAAPSPLAALTLAPIRWDLLGWALLAVVMFFANATAAGLEIGLFSLSRVRLRLRVHHRDPAALQLRRWLETPTYALEGLLILQNFASFLLVASVTALVAQWLPTGPVQVLVSTLILTPILLIFTDILPKDLFYTQADRWVYPLVVPLRWAFRLITLVPILPLVRLCSRAAVWLLARARTLPPAEIAGPRTEILNLFQETVGTGGMSGTQQDLVQRALRLARITIREVMIPWNRVVGVPAAISRDGFLALVRHYNVSRMPVLGRTTSEVLGFIETIDVLGDPADFNVPRHLQPAMTLIAEQSVRSALTLMQRARQTIAVVVDRQGRALGLVTMKDVIEELIGDVENW